MIYLSSLAYNFQLHGPSSIIHSPIPQESYLCLQVLPLFHSKLSPVHCNQAFTPTIALKSHLVFTNDSILPNEWAIFRSHLVCLWAALDTIMLSLRKSFISLLNTTLSCFLPTSLATVSSLLCWILIFLIKQLKWHPGLSWASSAWI